MDLSVLRRSLKLNKDNRKEVIIEIKLFLLMILGILSSLTLFFVLFSNNSYADELKYFDDGVSFWGKEEKKTLVETKEVTTEKKEGDKFNWNKYLDIKNDEFFKEGNHLPPAPLMEATRNPTEKNIENFEKWVQLRNEARQRFIKAFADYKKKNLNVSDEQIAFVNNRLEQVPELNVDNAKYAFTMYYDSNCPHCKRMVHTFKELNARGFFTIVKQVDNGRIKDDLSPLVIVQASKSEVQSLIKKGKGTPTTVVSTKDGKTYSISGYHPTNQLLTILNQRIVQGGTKQ